jgi:hypothetical protein
MLPLYTAINIEKAPLVGGSTQPCLLLATDYNGNLVGSYVVKIFKQRNIEQINGTAKEVYANVLAKHFDIAVPTAALIEVDQWLINALKQLPEYKNWDITEGVYFGTKYISGGIDYSDALNQNIEIWEKENIFAFDALIRNIDRTPRKTNLFLAGDTVYPLDHELSLHITNTFDHYLSQKDWTFLVANPKGGKHLFFNDLREFNQKRKITFDQFSDNLRTLKPEILLRKEAEQLEEFGISTFDYPPIEKYLKSAVQNTTLFIENLKKLLI